MGIWDYVCSSADSLKRNAPGLRPVKDLYSSSYAHGSSAASYIGNAVKASARKIRTLKQYLPDQQAQHKIARFTTSLAKNVASESAKFVPGGEFALKVVSKSYEDVFKSKNDDDDEVRVRNKKGKKERKLSSEEVEENYKASDDDEEYCKPHTAANHHLRPKM